MRRAECGVGAGCGVLSCCSECWVQTSVRRAACGVRSWCRVRSSELLFEVQGAELGSEFGVRSAEFGVLLANRPGRTGRRRASQTGIRVCAERRTAHRTAHRTPHRTPHPATPNNNSELRTQHQLRTPNPEPRTQKCYDPPSVGLQTRDADSCAHPDAGRDSGRRIAGRPAFCRLLLPCRRFLIRDLCL